MGAQDEYHSPTALPLLVAAAAGLALLAFCSYYYLLVARRRGQHRGGKPTKRYPPVVGTVFHQLYHVRRLHDYHTDLFRGSKTFRLLTPAGRRQIYTCDPAVVEHILRTNFANYGKVSTAAKLIDRVVNKLFFFAASFVACMFSALQGLLQYRVLPCAGFVQSRCALRPWPRT
jgi:hypothetical protein